MLGVFQTLSMGNVIIDLSVPGVWWQGLEQGLVIQKEQERNAMSRTTNGPGREAVPQSVGMTGNNSA